MISLVDLMINKDLKAKSKDQDQDFVTTGRLKMRDWKMQHKNVTG